MYVNGFILAVPIGNKHAYRDVAAKAWPLFEEFGALEIMEAWGASIPAGKVTDFRKSVKAEESEEVVFSWLIWPDRKTADAAHEKMFSDPRMAEIGEMPFDGKRMVIGGFEPLFSARKQS